MLAKALAFRFDAVGAIEPDQSIGRHIGSHRHQVRTKKRQQEFHAGHGDAFAERFEQRLALAPVDFQLQGALLQTLDRFVDAGAFERELLHRQQYEFFLHRLGALIGGTELANRFQAVAVEFEANRPAIAGRKQIDDAAAHAEIAALLDQRDILKTPVDQMIEQPLARQILANDNIEIGFF